MAEGIGPVYSGEPVWEWTLEKFEENAKKQTLPNIISAIQFCIKESAGYFRKSAEWYFAAGLWLNYVKEHGLYGQHGDWEKWVRNNFGISESQAGRYRAFASQGSRAFKVDACRGFSLDRELGYKGDKAPKPRPRGKQRKITVKAPEPVIEAPKLVIENCPPVLCECFSPGQYRLWIGKNEFLMDRKQMEELAEALENAMAIEDEKVV